MNTQSLKLELITWLANLKDKKLLESLFSVKESFEAGDWYDNLSESQKKSLEKGVDDYRKGRVLTSEEFWARYEKKA